jgi:LysM repeat protein
MALPSQSERGNDSNRSVMAQPDSGLSSAARTGLIILGIALVGVAGYAAANWVNKPKDPTKIADSAGKVTEPTAAPVTPPPTEFVQGQPLPGGATGTNTPSAGTSTTGGVTPFGQPATVARPGTGTPTTGTPGTAAPTTGGTTTTGATTGAPTQAATTGATPAGGATTPGTAPVTAPGATPMTTTDLGVLSLIEAGDKALRENKLVDARASFSKALLHKDASELDRETLRGKLGTINQDLVFGSLVAQGDPLVESYKVVAGDSLEKIRRKRELATDWRLIQRVNKIANPNSIRVGQSLKLVRGPFHAVVNKSAYRVDVFAGSPEDPANWLFIKGYRAGLGEGNSTPIGNYVIKKGSKLVNPPWVNPRTGERFDKDDPKNPIGEFWVGWQGMGDSKANSGYGFHGTIEPDSIGQQKSMGCVRLGSTDIAELYELLAEEVSVVRVMP